MELRQSITDFQHKREQHDNSQAADAAFLRSTGNPLQAPSAATRSASPNDQLTKMQQQVADLKNSLTLETQRTRTAQQAYVAALSDRSGVRALLQQLIADVAQQEEELQTGASAPTGMLVPAPASTSPRRQAHRSGLAPGRLRPRSATIRCLTPAGDSKHRPLQCLVEKSQAGAVLSSGGAKIAEHHRKYSKISDEQRAALLEVLNVHSVCVLLLTCSVLQLRSGS
jgi:hypothetical protein